MLDLFDRQLGISNRLTLFFDDEVQLVQLLVKASEVGTLFLQLCLDVVVRVLLPRSLSVVYYECELDGTDLKLLLLFG